MTGRPRTDPIALAAREGARGADARADRRDLAIVCLALGIGLALRVVFATGLHGSDDLTHAYAGAHFFGNPADADVGISGAFAVNLRRIGVNFPLWLSTSIFGVHEWSLSLVPLAFSLAGIPLAYATLRMLAGRRAGLVAAAVWAVLPVDVYHAANWLQDSIFATVLMAVIGGVVASARTPRRARAAFLAGLALGYLEYVKESAILVLVPIVAWLAVEPYLARRRRGARAEASGPDRGRLGDGVSRPRERSEGWLSTIESWLAGRLDRRLPALLAGFLLVQVVAALYFASVFHDPLYFWRYGLGRAAEVAANDLQTKHSLGGALVMVARYGFEQWVYGFAVVLFPVAAAAALLDRRTPLRLFLVLVLLVQLVVLVEAVKFGNWSRPPQSAQGAERYNLQLTPIFVVWLVLGVESLLRRLRAAERWSWAPAAAALALVALTGAALDPVHEQYDRLGIQVVRDAYRYLDRRAGADDPIYVDMGPLADADGHPLPDYTARVFMLLAGYRPWKGGLRPLEQALTARSGWVVVTGLERRRVAARGVDFGASPPPTWSEVYRSQRRGGRYQAQVFRLGASAAELELEPVPADRVQVSRRWSKTSQVTIAPGLDVRVTPTGGGAKHQGGLAVSVDGARAVRFRLELEDPAQVSHVFVHAIGADGKQVDRWSWNRHDRTQTLTDPITFVVGRASPPFRYQDEGLEPARVRELHIFIQVDGPAGFRVRDLEVAKP